MAWEKLERFLRRLQFLRENAETPEEMNRIPDSVHVVHI